MTNVNDAGVDAQLAAARCWIAGGVRLPLIYDLVAITSGVLCQYRRVNKISLKHER